MLSASASSAAVAPSGSEETHAATFTAAIAGTDPADLWMKTFAAVPSSSRAVSETDPRLETRTVTLRSTPTPVFRSNAGSAAAAPGESVFRCAWTLATTAFAKGCCRRHPGSAASAEVTSTTAEWSPGGRKPSRGAATFSFSFFFKLGANANSILFLYLAVDGAGSVGGTSASRLDASSGARDERSEDETLSLSFFGADGEGLVAVA
mmetsp:Transcript_5974/g.24233  ORF Transcript_5974/g.24233 Transcript_5974/m.24233 type:complete len:207 (-) Transcript_5974:630-1250(-)